LDRAARRLTHLAVRGMSVFPVAAVTEHNIRAESPVLSHTLRDECVLVRLEAEQSFVRPDDRILIAEQRHAVQAECIARATKLLAADSRQHLARGDLRQPARFAALTVRRADD